MQTEAVVALSQAGGLSIASEFQVVGLAVLGFLLLEILYLVAFGLFLAWDRGRSPSD